MENSWLEDAISREEIHFIAYDEFTHLEKIVESTSSSIYKAEWENYGLTIALKTIKEAYIRKDIFEEFVRELKHLQSIRFHENISHFYGISKDPDGYYKLVLQYANNGNLRDYLKDNFQKLQWIDKFRIAKEIAKGLVCLHNNGMMHRDLHSRNVLIHGGSALIADFGLAKLETSTSVSPSYFHGITAFMEPKCFVDQTYKRNTKSDVYSYGVILWEISSGRKPFQTFKSREAIAIQIFRGNREKPVEGTPSEYIELYTQCWDGVPDKRPDMKTALNIINQLEQKDSNKEISRSLKGLLDIAIFDNHINYHDYDEFSEITKIDEEEFGSVYKSVWNKNNRLMIVLKCLKVKEDYLNELIVQNFANKVLLSFLMYGQTSINATQCI
ncbi:kinase-like domain-containing protein [Gigaspora rosea]|uniref:Kinase-like domain-containing protein n=1 Tax=Gigaspora rosea TaxID=44941 RepID=A0A397VR85_9GLOM|nr:kinase-like domain-containing protein [Gigaspora rosea]